MTVSVVKLRGYKRGNNTVGIYKHSNGIIKGLKGLVSEWQQLGSDIDGETAGDWSGRSVSLSTDGTTVAIGANFNDGTGSSAGHVRVYTYSGSAWTQLGSDIDGEAATDQSGYSVSLSGNGSRVAIGAIFNDGGGSNRGPVST